MFKKIAYLIFLVVFSLALATPAVEAAPLASETIVASGEVSGIWGAAGSPYLIEGDIIIPAGASLTIEPGVEVLFQGWYKLTVNGLLDAQGTETAPILFGGGHPTAGWLGIRFENAPDGSILSHAIVENGSASGAAPLNRGGGIYVDHSNPVIMYSTIRNNRANYSGGGIYLNYADATLVGNTILNNQAGTGAGSANGGGITILYSDPVLSENIIVNNSVSVSGSYSTPSGYGGGLFVRSSNAAFSGNVIADNHVYGHANSYSRGGGLYLYYGSPVFVGNTITGNTAENDTTGVYSIVEGGGIYSYHSNPTFVNSILWGDAPQEIYVSNYGVSSEFTFAYTDLQGGQAGIVTNDSANIQWGTGNLDQDPLFVDAAGGDFNLTAGSTLIDAGTAYFEHNGSILVDLAASEYNGAAPDMGAFEYGDFGGQNQPPVALASVSPDHGSAPLEVQFSSAGSYDPDGVLVSYSWDFGDGATSSEENPVYTYSNVGTYQAVLTVTDDLGATHSSLASVEVQDGTTVYAGEVSGIWTESGSPYRIEGDIYVPAGETLNIEAGVQVLFQSAYHLTINGTLLAYGTDTLPIIFTSGSTPAWVGIRFLAGSDASVFDHVIVENGRATGASPYDSGGGIYVQNASPTISNSLIQNNLANAKGGGFYLENSDALLVGNTISGNQAGRGGTAYGGGIYIDGGSPQLIDNTINGNAVSVAGSYSTPYGRGGAIYARDAVLRLAGNLIFGNAVNGSNNHYARGGALYLSGSDADLVGNTIFGNTVGDGGSYYMVDEGGGIYTVGSRLTIVNSVLWNDTPQEIFASESGVSSIITVTFSDVQGGQAAVVTNSNATLNWEGGNINTDPMFASAGNGDFSLLDGSPAVDAGTAYFSWAGRVLVDLSPQGYNGNAPDMGALESPFSSSPANQAPIAAASADLQSGSAPLTVQFSSAGSRDADGVISAYLWDFGDGNTSTEANPRHTYASAGEFTAVLTVTDDVGATDSASVVVQVSPASQNELHVQSLAVGRNQTGKRAWQGFVTVLIVDQNDQPVAGVAVTVSYDGPNSGQVSGVAGGDGTVTLVTDAKNNPKGGWCFAVVDIAGAGYIYNPGSNLVTSLCE